jgi:cell division initiation protein
MYTPQEVQEKTFVKAVFGGYDMQSVDEFLEPLIEDYVTLYKENSVLNSKMKVLVEKLEEYRAQEESMKKAILAAQRTSDEMIAEAERKSARILNEAEGSARNRSVSAQQEIDNAEERVVQAQKVAQDFITQIEQQVKQHLSTLEGLRTLQQHTPAVHTKRPYDFETEADDTRSASDVAREIEQSVGRIVGETPTEPADPAATRVMEPITDADLKNAKFSDLKFGKNYDPYEAKT